MTTRPGKASARGASASTRATLRSCAVAPASISWLRLVTSAAGTMASVDARVASAWLGSGVACTERNAAISSAGSSATPAGSPSLDSCDTSRSRSAAANTVRGALGTRPGGHAATGITNENLAPAPAREVTPMCPPARAGGAAQRECMRCWRTPACVRTVQLDDHARDGEAQAAAAARLRHAGPQLLEGLAERKRASGAFVGAGGRAAALGTCLEQLSLLLLGYADAVVAAGADPQSASRARPAACLHAHLTVTVRRIHTGSRMPNSRSLSASCERVDGARRCHRWSTSAPRSLTVSCGEAHGSSEAEQCTVPVRAGQNLQALLRT
jgi:hypothetical protein